MAVIARLMLQRDAVALGFARHAGDDGNEVWLRRWVVRRVHGAVGWSGAAVVHYDVSQAVGKQITTIEGLGAASGSSGLHPLQQAWIDEEVPQCGYCQWADYAGGVAAEEDSASNDDEITNAMDGNLCRCGSTIGFGRRFIGRLGKHSVPNNGAAGGVR